MNYKTYADLSIDILQEIYKIPSDIHLVVGIPRSGMIPAYMIGAQLNLPVMTLNEFLSENWQIEGERKLKSSIEEIRNVLVIDDSIHSGRALAKAKEKLTGKNREFNFFFAVVYSANLENNLVDFYLKYLPQPRAFQWNFKNHFTNAKACFDIDGVLCVDPTEEENDDGKAYLEFLRTAKPLFITSQKISCLVTSRLEKYREQTEIWLQKQGVNYDELIMLKLPSARERRALGIHAQFKAEVYANRPEQLFVESNWNQAKEIFKITGKPVFCVENDVLIKSLTDIAYHENAAVYTERYFNEFLSEEPELKKQLQNLYWQLSENQQEIQKLNKKLKKLEGNKWVKFSRLSRVNKLKFLLLQLIKP